MQKVRSVCDLSRLFAKLSGGSVDVKGSATLVWTINLIVAVLSRAHAFGLACIEKRVMQDTNHKIIITIVYGC